MFAVCCVHVLWDAPDPGNKFYLMLMRLWGSERGQSRCRLYADKAAAAGAETLYDSRSWAQFRQQKAGAWLYMLSSSITSVPQWCVKRRKGEILSVDGGEMCRCASRAEPVGKPISRADGLDLHAHGRMQVIKRNQAWRQVIRKTCAL